MFGFTLSSIQGNWSLNHAIKQLEQRLKKWLLTLLLSTPTIHFHTFGYTFATVAAKCQLSLPLRPLKVQKPVLKSRVSLPCKWDLVKQWKDIWLCGFLFLIKLSDKFHNVVLKLQMSSAYQPRPVLSTGLFKFFGESLINSCQQRICIIVAPKWVE